MKPKTTISSWLAEATARLKKGGIASARLDALVFLSDALNWDKVKILAEGDLELKKTLIQKLNSALQKRLKHQPLAYIRGKSEFYGREFLINNHVLQPRPESEAMIEVLLNLAKSHQLTANSYIADIGTGSGCLAITAKLELPTAHIFAIDIDLKCLKIARKNAKIYNADIKFHEGSLLEPLFPLPYSLSIIIANLPYVPDNFTLNSAALNEPKTAIFGGKDGLDHYRALFAQLAGLKSKPRFVLTESLPFQHKKLAFVAQKCGYRLQKTTDFIQCFQLG